MLSYPILITNLAQPQQALSNLEPVSRDTPPYNESWLQSLIHDHPGLIPASEIEACFDNLVPISKEFPLSSGYLDNLFVTPDGYLVLVEVKLWKNGESRRKVIAQILEYAMDFAALAYDQINKEIRKQGVGRSWGQNPLYEMVASYAANPLDETLFVDRVSRNLREGRFLLLILGDGIREDMAVLANHLMHHSLRYAFAMVQIKLFHLPDGSLIALPEVLVKTQTVERHVTVVTMAGDIAVRGATPTSVVNEQVENTSISLDEFYASMAHVDPQNVVWLKDLLNKLADLPIETQLGARGESLMLKATVSTGERIQFIVVNPTNIQFWGIPNKEWKSPAWQRLSHSYLEEIATSIPGASIKVYAAGMDIKSGGKYLPTSVFQGRNEILADAIRRVKREAEGFYITENAE
jgi:hypothetical protein